MTTVNGKTYIAKFANCLVEDSQLVKPGTDYGGKE